MEGSGRLLLSLATREGARSLWASEAGKCGVVGPQKALLLPLLSLGKGTVISHREGFLFRVGVGDKASPSGAAYLSGELFPKFQSKTPGKGTLGPAGLAPRAHVRSWTPLHAPWPSIQRNNCRREGFGSIFILDSTDPFHSSFKALNHRFFSAA